MNYLKYWVFVLIILSVLAFAFWALSAASRAYFEKKDFQRRLDARMREIDEEVRRNEH